MKLNSTVKLARTMLFLEVNNDWAYNWPRLNPPVLRS